MRIFDLDVDGWSPEPAYNTVARRFFPWDGFEPGTWGGAWVAVRPGETSTPHSHSEHEVFFVVRGEGQLVHGDEVHPVRYGTSMKMEPGVHHSLSNTGDEDLVFISVWWEDPQPAANASPAS